MQVQVLVINNDDSQKKSAHEEVIAFCNGCENLTTHQCKTCFIWVQIKNLARHTKLRNEILTGLFTGISILSKHTSASKYYT